MDDKGNQDSMLVASRFTQESWLQTVPDSRSRPACQTLPAGELLSLGFSMYSTPARRVVLLRA
jgi:hypothetical protein